MPAVMRLRLVCYFEILVFGSLLFCKNEYEVAILSVLYVKLSSVSFCFEDDLESMINVIFCYGSISPFSI